MAFSEHGRVPPQAVDLEEAVLGALMLEQNALTAVVDILKPDVFYKEAHQVIYAAIHRLFAKSEPIDILTVTNELKSSGELELIGGAYYITQLTNRVASTANIEYHARIISQKFIQRELIKLSSEIIKDAFEDTTDVFDLLDKAEKNLFAVSETNFRRDYDSMQSLVREAIKDIESARDHEGNLRGVPSGFTDVDRITGGWQKSDLVILAARPGMGKTAFVLSMARNIAVDFNIPLAIFSLEMSSIQLVTRLISSETQLSADKLKKGNLENYEWEQLNAKIGKLVDAPLFIDDTPALSIFELRAKCRRLKAQHDIQMIIIDYIQLMSTGGDNKGNREQEISTISRSLKALAKELNVPVITLSQLNRSVETRGGSKRPLLSDLRESGAIEQDADLVLFIYRPEYYKIDQDEEGNSTQGLAELIIAKHRNGALADVKMTFIDRFAKFTDFDGPGGFEYQGDISSDYEYPQENSYTIPSRMDDIPEDDNPF
ncbi:MAG TPA: replicative DNA helicase [Bacteroidales bacterium]|nr:replicative DNA helicase [Bacteroidales bacterium]HPE58174.1 replicative DNA helicase [Bacteroidales bacterium]HRX96417.1 replicative DNA helicase [Bacteroidales bacterium]